MHLQDRLVDEAGISAIICLQSEICHDALQIECAAAFFSKTSPHEWC